MDGAAGRRRGAVFRALSPRDEVLDAWRPSSEQRFSRGSLARVACRSTCNLPWRDTIFGASRLWVRETRCSQPLVCTHDIPVR